MGFVGVVIAIGFGAKGRSYFGPFSGGPGLVVFAAVVIFTVFVVVLASLVRFVDVVVVVVGLVVVPVVVAVVF